MVSGSSVARNEPMQYPMELEGRGMHIGFTGTRGIASISDNRLSSLLRFLTGWCEENTVTLHHGDCFGADAYVHKAMVDHCDVIIHPSNLAQWTVGCTPYKYRYDPKPPLARNRDIVRATDFLVGLPVSVEREELRSGTWATIRYARKLGREIFLF